ncbi:P-loop NTPase [Haloarcula sp. GH36]|uniref:P-loop NTPase n=1 Tax=Haloarcula montana TaxID=3111776 RepID=UPI002D7912B0|nr:P-loop NTPase [Haloarcula sp. GH36]
MSTDGCTVYTVAGAKGGVGRTTTSINLGVALANAGHDAAVLELDLAMANLTEFLDVEATTTLHGVLAGEATVADATYPAAGGLSLVPSGTSLEGYARTDLSTLPGVVDTLRERHDAILVDTPAGLSEETVRAMELADEAVLVSTPRVSSVRNANETLPLAGHVETAVSGLILTKSGAGIPAVADHVASCLDVSVLGRVPEDDAVPYAQEHGEPVVEHAPHSGAAVAYRKIARRLTEPTTANSSAMGRADSTACDGPATGDRSNGSRTSRDSESGGPDTSTDDIEQAFGNAGTSPHSSGRQLQDVFDR